jgi:hypothetical protein
LLRAISSVPYGKRRADVAAVEAMLAQQRVDLHIGAAAAQRTDECHKRSLLAEPADGERLSPATRELLSIALERLNAFERRRRHSKRTG